METFYDGDLKDIWDSDLDPTESLKISTDTDLHDWFLERDIKDPAVILNDKLISDALLNGTLPIKTEHSYSLNSDGDSLPDSPRSLQSKMDDMEDECYPAISLKTATSNLRHHHHSLHHVDTAATIDPKCLTISTSSPTTTAAAVAAASIAMHCSPVAVTSLATSNIGNNHSHTMANSLLTTTPASTSGFSSHAAVAANTTTATTLPFHHSHHNNNQNHNSIYAGLNKITASAPMTFNLRNLDNSNNNHNNHNIGGGATTITFVKNTIMQPQSQQQQQQQQYLPQQHISSMDSESICDSPISTRDGSTSPDICSDIEIDESFIKDEPMSPDSSCPPSPNTTNAKAKGGGGGSTLSLSMANMAQYTNSDLVFEHKNGCLQLTPASHSLLKSQQLILSSNSSNSQNIMIPKFNIKNETTTLPNGTYINGTTPAKHNNNGAGTYGLPLTPPSSSPSDESEGNLTPEHLLSPLSPNTSVSISVATAAASGGPAIVTTTARRSTSSSSSSSSSNNSNCLSAGGGRNINGGSGGGGGGSTRQPIHTPLISSQPKGSTGTLILTEEEKRTLLAEGYPIPQKLPLTKAEEKSLKKIRRKIKNKISAQESRRKKKEYMDQLERRVEILVNENNDYRKRVETLEDSNSNLLSQLHKLQALVNKQNMKK